MAVHFEAVIGLDALVESQRGDAEDFLERRFLLRASIVVQPPRELAQDRLLAVPAHADNERHGEFLAVSIVETMEIGELRLAELVEAGRGLFGRRIRGEVAL